MECEKCGYKQAEKKQEVYLCSVCKKFAPSEISELEAYTKEKLNWKDLETFRKFSLGKINISGMEKKAKEGKIMSRAAFGYRIENKELIPDTEKKLIVQKIFMDFLEQDISLNQLAKKNKFSVNGIKKILKNFTYIGKIKFSGQIMQGKHPGIISPEIFNKVQSKLESL